MESTKRAYRYRFYPDEEQAVLLAQTFGCVRVVWNHILATRTKRYRVEGASTSYADSDKLLTQMKRQTEFSWLNDVSSVPLQQTLRHQHAALQNFFAKRAHYPKFKSKGKDSDSATFTRFGFTFKDGKVKLAKMKSPLNIRWSRPLPEGAVPSSVTISLDRSGRYHISLLVDEVIPHLDPEESTIGVDLGVNKAIVTSDGETLHPDLSSAIRKVKKMQKAYSRTSKGSARREKARTKLAKAHAHLADSRRDFLHKTSTKLVKENRMIVLEDLNVKGMTSSARGTVENPGKNVSQKAGLNRGILNHSFGEFRSMVEYKASWYGREVVLADRFYPSSKTCSNCGHYMSSMPLKVRSWTCPDCKTTHDRDINAAVNLKAFALGHREKKNARGGPIKPVEFAAQPFEARTTTRVSAGIPRL